MISKTVRRILQALSYDSKDVESARRIADLRKLDTIRIFLKKLDVRICNGEHEIPVRLYFPTEQAMRAVVEEGYTFPILLFFHGGGWIKESVENYDRVCARMAQSTSHIVASVEYRLAPEYPFPTGLEDCYAAAKALYEDPKIPSDKITIMGDSAGGNLAAAVTLLAKERGDFMPRRQILIYPALNNCYTKESPYPSVKENGQGYLLTASKMENFLSLYQSSPQDRNNPLFAPILAKDLHHMPETLILTAEFDPLRDEGEAYGEKLREAGNYVEIHRIKDALHGFFALGIRFLHVQESFEYMNEFLKREAVEHWNSNIQNGEN